MKEKIDIRGSGQKGAGAGTRRPWQPPRIISRESLEVIAAACTGAGAKPDAAHCGLSGNYRS